MHMLFVSICSIMIVISLTSNFRASKALREMRENMYRAKIFTFAVISMPNLRTVLSDKAGNS